MLVLAALLTASPVSAQSVAEDVTQTVKQGCQKELDTFCKKVKPGEGRVLACLYAFSDQVSGRCEYALYDAAQQLEKAITKLNYVASSCADDLDKFCAKIQPGGGRIAQCLKKNQANTSPACQQAMKDTGMAGK
jgi:hypothetical protein